MLFVEVFAMRGFVGDTTKWMLRFARCRVFIVYKHCTLYKISQYDYKRIKKVSLIINQSKTCRCSSSIHSYPQFFVIRLLLYKEFSQMQ